MTNPDTRALQALADKVEAGVVYYVFDIYSGDQEFWSLSEDRAKAFREAIQAKVGRGAYYRVSSHPLDQAFFDEDADCALIVGGRE